MNLMNLLEQVKNDLKATKGDWVSIAQQAGISYSWITKFMADEIPNPGFYTLERLNSILRKAA